MENGKTRGQSEKPKKMAPKSAPRRGTMKGQTARRLNELVWIEQNDEVRIVPRWSAVERVWFEPKEGVKFLQRPPTGHGTGSPDAVARPA